MRRAIIAMLAGLAVLVPSIGATTPAPAAKPSARTRQLAADLYPATPYAIIVRQPDGTTFKGKLNNGEVGGHLETLDGYTLTKARDGWWYYAERAKGAKVFASKRRAGVDSPAGLQRGLGRIPNIWSGELGRLRDQTLRTFQMASHQRMMKAAAAGEQVRFKTPFLMIATWYDKEAGQTSPQFAPEHDKEHFTRMLDGFGGNPTGSMTEFWLENSYGQFYVDVDVIGPFTSYRSLNDPCYYGNTSPENQQLNGEDIVLPDGSTIPRLDDGDPVGNFLGLGGLGAVGMAFEAVPQADAQGVNFADYDNDGDGKVDFVGLIHSGPDMAATGDPCQTWSHMFQVSFLTDVAGSLAGDPVGSAIAELGREHGGIPTNDVNSAGLPVVVDRVLTMPEIGADIGVAVHEMMHAVGEPDYYNPSYTSQGTGDWDIMAGGSWFGNPPGSNPMGANPATRVMQGWVKPTVVHGDMRNVALRPRELAPKPGYTVNDVDPNLILVPTKWTDSTEPADVWGLAKDPANGKYITEGWYIEYISRSVNGKAVDERMSRAPYFGRFGYSSGLMIWHFDYYKKSNVFYGTNNAQNDPNRPQLDPEEFDYNDNTQELQLNLTRGEPSDLWFGAATGMTSATHQPPPGIPTTGTPQAKKEGSGVTYIQDADYDFTVDDNPGNYKLTAVAVGQGDCKLQLLRKKADGTLEPQTGEADSGAAGDPEQQTVIKPKAGEWVLRVGDFAACGQHTWSVVFSRPDLSLFTSGAAATWTNPDESDPDAPRSGSPTGWAFTNIGPRAVDGLKHAAESPGPDVITLDILKLDGSDVDVSPGFARPPATTTEGLAPVSAAEPTTIRVPVFNNGGKAASAVTVTLREEGGAVIGTKVVSLAGFKRDEVSFAWTPSREGKIDLIAEVDPAGKIAEAHEGNNLQTASLIVGPRNPSVLVVDDEGSNDFEQAYLGALTALGVPYAVAYGHVDVATMRSYDAVIWEAGLDRYQGQLNDVDRAKIRQYLDGGGKLWMASPRLAGALGEGPSGTNPGWSADMPALLKNYFGVAYDDTLQVGGGILTGKGDSSGIGGSRKIEIDILPGRPLQDVWSAGSSDIGTVGTLLDYSKGGQMAVAVRGDAAHKKFKTVYFGFNLRQVVSGDEQVRLTGEILKYLGVRTGTYAPSVPLVFHSAERVRKSGEASRLVLYSFNGAAPALHYRAHGRGGWETDAMKPGAYSGVYSATIPGKWATPLGIDYWVSAAVSQPDGGGSLANYVGVGNPARAVPASSKTAVKGVKQGRDLPATGVGTPWTVAVILLGATVVLASWLRRRPA